MTLTVTIEGTGLLTNAESITNWNAVTIGSEANETDVYLQGNQAVSSKASSKAGELYYDCETDFGRDLDFDTAGTEEDQFIGIWVAVTTLQALDTLANDGLTIRLYNDSTHWAEWIIAGSGAVDNFRQSKGGFVFFLLDPTLSPSTTAISFDYGAVSWIGCHIDTTAQAKAENLIIDSIMVGTGIRVTGTDTDGWEDIVDYCTDYANRAWGFVDYDDTEEVIYIQGKIYIGEDGGSVATSLTDGGRTIKFTKKLYYNASAAWVPMLPDTANGIVVEDDSTYATTFTDGTEIGTGSGYGGSLFIGDVDILTTIDLYGGNNAASITGLYSTTFKQILGAITWGNDADHECYSVVFNGCGQFQPIGAVKIRNCQFIDTQDSYSGGNPNGSALLWHSTIDITDCQFIANTDATYDPHAIQHDTATTVTYYDLLFTGNDYDIHFTPGSGDLTVNKDGTSNPSLDDVEGSGSVTYVGTVNLKLIVKDADGNALVGARTLMEADSGGADPYLASVNITSSGVTATVAHTTHGMATGEMVNIRGANQPEYNGAGKVITVTGSSAYTYTISGAPASPATGTITATQCYISEVTIAGGVAEESYAAGATQPYRGVVRWSTTPNIWRDVTYSGSDASGGLTLPIQMGADT